MSNLIKLGFSQNYGLGLLYIELSRPPLLEELISSLSENRELDIGSMITKPYSRIWLPRLLSVKNPIEIGSKIIGLYREEFNYIGSQLHSEYAGYIHTFLEFLVIDEIFALLYSKNLGEIGPSSTEAMKYKACIAKDPLEIYMCLLKNVVEKTHDHIIKLKGKREKALAVVIAMAMSKLIRYLENEKRLGFERSILPLSTLGKLYEASEHIDEYILWKCRDIIERAWNKYSSDPLLQFVNEVKEIHWFLKNELYYLNDLLALLTFYLVTRYYETYLLRYLVTRGLLKW